MVGAMHAFSVRCGRAVHERPEGKGYLSTRFATLSTWNVQTPSQVWSIDHNAILQSILRMGAFQGLVVQCSTVLLTGCSGTLAGNVTIGHNAVSSAVHVPRAGECHIFQGTFQVQGTTAQTGIHVKQEQVRSLAKIEETVGRKVKGLGAALVCSVGQEMTTKVEYRRIANVCIVPTDISSGCVPKQTKRVDT